MSISTSAKRRKSADSTHLSLPQRMRVLFITTSRRNGGWLSDSLANDSACEVSVCEALGRTEGVARLREELFDVVLVGHDARQLDAIDLVAALRGGGADEPIIVLGNESEQEMAAFCYEAGADAYLCAAATTTRSLLWVIARGMERSQLLRENRRLHHCERQRVDHEQSQAERLLTHQKELMADLHAQRPAGGELAAAALPDVLVSQYRELLRAYVMMGCGRLTFDLSAMGELLARAGISSAQTLELHVGAVDELVEGLGSRSALHVMSRADALLLEVVVHLAEAYRRLHPSPLGDALQ